MDTNVISKKDLLELTGISYGQLYRWKRKNLIPEEWFIRRATFTGQETFFPREQILARIDKILNMKDDLSLDELADMFSPSMSDTSLTAEELLARNIVSTTSLEVFNVFLGSLRTFTFQQALYAYVLEKLLAAGDLSVDEGGGLLQVLASHYPKFEGKPCELIFMRKMGISTFVLVSGSTEMYFDSGVKVVKRLDLANCIEELKGKYL
ncbi:YhbD family protein [Brevibacillus sp. M2.1A]|uniref:YhbD family protein n=1 Tax=Brevibacillus TaxID=55080 RepID=UPI00156A9B70|nr:MULTISPECIES: YhbD family protein [Brevibacillus]MBY0084979.1 YhbD family protein [Brevibacillus brevis]MCC8433108.1 YhbD family protein [Brevibacillus sp. M2.1A]MCM3143584.1 YhbD family protein [Brevibacillus sp. MER 51]